jgi:hypothetical protein
VSVGVVTTSTWHDVTFTPMYNTHVEGESRAFESPWSGPEFEILTEIYINYYQVRLCIITRGWRDGSFSHTLGIFFRQLVPPPNAVYFSHVTVLCSLRDSVEESQAVGPM